MPVNLDLKGPDLQLLSATAPGAVGLGSVFSLSWTVQNMGAASANTRWFDAIYLSKDNTQDSNDVLIGYFSNPAVSPLASGDRYTSSETVSVPSDSAAGQYFLIIQTDSFAHQNELSETNNSFTLPITIFNKAPDPPTVTVSVDPQQGLPEDGAANLIYTLTRSGPTTSELTVFFVIDERASNAAIYDVDFKQNAAVANPDPQHLSISFLPGSATASLILDPVSDSLVEPDEDIYFQLLPDKSYIVGTTAYVLGRILNDDVNSYTPGPTTLNGVNLGSTTEGYALVAGSAPSIQVTYPGGSASPSNPGNGWSAVAATPSGSGYALYWHNSGSGQTARWDLNSGGAYISGSLLSASQVLSEEASLSFDINGDGTTAGPTTLNGVNLGRNAQGYALLTGNSPLIPVTYPGGNASPSNPGNGWSAVAATPSGSHYALYWRNSGSGQTARWDLNSGGAYISGSLLSASDVLSEEAKLNFDLNGDGTTAGPTTLKGVNLGRSTQGYALLTGNSPPIPVTYPGGNASPSNPGNGWSAVAATPSGSGYALYWRNGGTLEAVRWELSNGGAYTSGSFLSASQLVSEEANLNLDLNGDGYTTGMKTIGSINLGKTGLGYAIRNGSAAPIQVSYSGINASESSPGNGWEALAATTSASGYLFYWRNSSTGQAARWSLNSGGAYQSGALLSASQLISEETVVNADLNGDSIIGGSFVTLESNGTAALLRQSSGMAVVRVGTDQFSITSPFSLGTGDNSSTWQMLAAETVGGLNQILWRNNPGNFLHVWTLNSSWSCRADSKSVPRSLVGAASIG